jgi:hypothetical protein
MDSKNEDQQYLVTNVLDIHEFRRKKWLTSSGKLKHTIGK